MSSPSRKRGEWLSVPPPILAPGTGDMSSISRYRNSPTRRAEGARPPNEVGSRASTKRESKLQTRSPPVWHPAIDMLGRPIVRGRSPGRRYSRDATERVEEDEAQSPSGRNARVKDSARISEAKGGKSPSKRPPRTDTGTKMDAEGSKSPSRRDSSVGKITHGRKLSPAKLHARFKEPPESPSRRDSDVGKAKVPVKTEEASQQPVSSTTATEMRFASSATAKVRPLHRSLAKQNEAKGHSNRMEEVKDLSVWESFNYNYDRLWRKFGDWNTRRNLKDVAASRHVLRTYHDAYLKGTVPFSTQARTWLRDGMLGTFWHIMEFFLSVLSGCLYIYSTYVPEARTNWCSHIQNCISIGFLCDYILRIYAEPVRFYYIFSFWGLADLLSVIPVILVFRTVIFGGNVIRLLQFVRTLRIFDLINKLGLIGTSVTEQIVSLTIVTFGAIILDAGLLQWLEYFSASQEYRASCPVEGCLSFWQAFYFLVVTVSTVGYGDISPKTSLGQVLTCLTIACALIAIPLQIQKIHSLAAKRPYGGSFSTRKIVGSRFLIVTGSITFPGVQSFLAEFFKPTHRQELEIYPLRVIILGPFVPSFDFKQLLACYNGHAEFIQGSPIRQPDLERVSVHKAMAVFLLADPEAEDWKSEDSAQIVRALAVHRFCRANCENGQSRIILEVLAPETQRSAVWDELHAGHIEVICPARIHYKMMARSCFVKGLYTFITNLFTSELSLKYIKTKHFLTEYFHSFDNEVYPVILPEAFHNLPFEEVAELIFINFSSTLFAVDTEVVSQSSGKKARHVLLFPRGYPIRLDDVGMVITNDLLTAFSIASYKERDDNIGRFQKLWDLVTKTSDLRRTTTEGIQLLDPVTHKWIQSSSGIRRVSVTTTENFGIQGPHEFPTNQDSGYRLESQLRSAIHTVYSNKEYPSWRDHKACVTESGKGEARQDAKASTEIKSDHSLRFLKGMSLEQAAEEILAWPPVIIDERPHPAVLEQREHLILSNLQERRIPMMAINKPHILVCCQAGWPTNLFYFLAEHRKPSFPNPPIAILHPHNPTTSQWGAVGIFEDVFFIKGSPLYELDLMRGGILQALKIVILSDQGIPVDLGGAGLEDERRYGTRAPATYTSDVENIVIAATVQRLYGSSAAGLVIVEMQHAEGFHYLRPQYFISLHHFRRKDFRRSKDALLHFGPPYMEGRAVSVTMLGFLMRSTFYNKNTVSIVEQLVQGGFVATEEGLSPDRPRVLDQIPVPTEYANKAYSFLFLSLLQDKGMLALGLYRVRGTLGAPTSYVLTNPPKDCVVNPDDLVFVIT